MLRFAVYFIYPETANVRLEDMNALFGDATTAMPTPAQQADAAASLARGSPVPSFTLGQHGADSAIPGLDINPPVVTVENGKPMISRQTSDREGLGGWISNLVKRSKRGNGDGIGRRSSYKPLGQGEE